MRCNRRQVAFDVRDVRLLKFGVFTAKRPLLTENPALVVASLTDSTACQVTMTTAAEAGLTDPSADTICKY